MFRFINILLLIISLAFVNCNAQSDLRELCADIRKAPETDGYKVKDKKFHLLQKLKNFDSDEAADSMKAIFLSLKNWDYVYIPLDALSNINSKKSLLVLSEIIRDYPLDMPGNMFFLWELKYKTKNVSVMYPNITKSLGIQKWTDHDVLLITVFANRKGHLTREQLEGSKDDFIRFYEVLKIEKDSLPGRKHYEQYYNSNLTELLACLRILRPDERINNVYRDVLAMNSSFKTFCSVGFVDYHNNSKLKLTALLQAVLGLSQNDQPVEEKYLELIATEPLYHNELYSELLKINKQSIFPKKYLAQEFFALSDLAATKDRTKNDGLPDCLEFLGKREVLNGDNKGVYYFYNAIYNDESGDRFISVSGPQPLSPTEFEVKGKKTNKIYVGPVKKNEVEMKIEESVRKMD